MEHLTREEIDQQIAPIEVRIEELQTELSKLKGLKPDTECWEVRYCSVGDEEGKVFQSASTKNAAIAWASDREKNSVFGYLSVVPKLIGMIATDGEVS